MSVDDDILTQLKTPKREIPRDPRPCRACDELFIPQNEEEAITSICRDCQ